MIGWGVATSAYQVEGAVDEDGRGRSTWDEFTARPGTVLDGTDGSVACDSYHRLDDDLALLTGLGVSAYRFSVAWPRVQPTGAGPANPRGFAYYDALVDRLLEAGIRPFPTLFHWDLPLALEEAGGWPARDTAARFADYAVLVAERLGDRIGTWATMNEPWCTAFLGHASGVFAPGRRDPAGALAAAHHLLLGHALAAEALEDLDRDLDVGIVLNLTTVRCEPAGDPVAADVVDALQNRLWIDALVDGSYPAVLPMDAVRPGDLERIRGSAAWLGVNYYTPYRIGPPAPDSGAVGQDVDAFPGAPPFAFAPRPPHTTMGWEVDPSGLDDTVRWLAGRAAGVPLRITENGGAFPDPLGEDDVERVDYLRGHLEVVERLVADGLPLRDYFAWSLLDNFEWAQGYTQRFGLVAVEPETLRRVPKASYRFYADWIAGAPVTDRLESGADRSRRPRGAAAVVAVALVLVVAERGGASRESAALVRCVERAEAALAHGAARVAGAVQYASPLLTGAATPPAVRQSLAAVVADAATRSLPSVDAAARGCAAAEVLPWHDATRAAFSSYRDLVEVRRARLVAVTGSVRALYAPDDDVRIARETALTALAAALGSGRERRVRELVSP